MVEEDLPFISMGLYIIGCAIINLVLSGIYLIVMEVIDFIRYKIMELSIKLFIWRMKRKYKIK